MTVTPHVMPRQCQRPSFPKPPLTLSWISTQPRSNLYSISTYNHLAFVATIACYVLDQLVSDPDYALDHLS